MLTEAQKMQVIKAAHRFQLGQVEFRTNGLIYFQRMTPIIEQVRKAFPHFEVVDAGEDAILEERPDDMRFAHWVTMRADTNVGA